MKPVVTIRSNLVYGGPPDVGDLHAEAVHTSDGIQGIRAVWTMTLEERSAIAAGRNIAVTVWGGVDAKPSIWPTSVDVADPEEDGAGEDDPAARARLAQWAGRTR